MSVEDTTSSPAPLDGKQVRANELHFASIFAGQKCAVQDLHNEYIESLRILKEKQAKNERLRSSIKDLGRETLVVRQHILNEKNEMEHEHRENIEAIVEQMEEYAKERDFYEYTSSTEKGVLETLLGEIEASVRNEMLETAERKEMDDDDDDETSRMFDTRTMSFEEIRLAFAIRQAANQGLFASIGAIFAIQRASGSTALTQRLRRLRAMQREAAARAEEQRVEKIRKVMKVEYAARLSATRERLESIRKEIIHTGESGKEQIAALKDDIALMREELRQLATRRKTAVRAAMEIIESNDGFEAASSEYARWKARHSQIATECEKYREAIRYMATQIGSLESTVKCRTSPDAKRVGKLLTEQILRKQQLQADRFVREYLESHGMMGVSGAIPDKASTSPRATPSALAGPSDLGDFLHDTNAGRASCVVRPSDPSHECARALVASDVEIGHVALKKHASLEAVPVGLFDDHTAMPTAEPAARPSEPSHESFETLVDSDAGIGHRSQLATSSHLLTAPDDLRSTDAATVDRLRPSNPDRIGNALRGIEAIAIANVGRVDLSPVPIAASSAFIAGTKIAASVPAEGRSASKLEVSERPTEGLSGRLGASPVRMTAPTENSGDAEVVPSAPAEEVFDRFVSAEEEESAEADAES